MLRVGLALADALAHAHGRGVIHRDVKPQNVIVPDRPRSARSAAKLTDFGVAHLAGDAPLTRTGDVVGTLAYMAPGAGRRAAGRRARRPLLARARALRGRSPGVEPGAGGQPGRDRAPARHGAAAAARASARTCRPSCAPRSTARSRRGRRTAARSTSSPTSSRTGLTDVSDEGGTILAHPLERPRTARAAARGGPDRRRAAPAAGLAGGGRHARPASPPVAPLAAAGAAAVAVARAAAGRLAGVRGRAGGPARGPTGPGAALVVAGRARAAAALVRGSRPRLVAARRRAAARPGRRSPAPTRPSPGRAGALVAARGRSAPPGLWWLLLAEPLLDRTLAARRADPPRGWEADAGRALDGVLWPPLALRAAPRSPRCGRWRRSCCPGSCAAATPGIDLVAASAWAAGPRRGHGRAGRVGGRRAAARPGRRARSRPGALRAGCCLACSRGIS